MKKEMNCPKCSKEAYRVGIEQYADGRVFTMFWCSHCEDNFKIEKAVKEELQQEIKRRKVEVR